MTKIKTRIETLRQVETDQTKHIQQLQIEKQQFIGVINGMQNDHQNTSGK